MDEVTSTAGLPVSLPIPSAFPIGVPLPVVVQLPPIPGTRARPRWRRQRNSKRAASIMSRNWMACAGWPAITASLRNYLYPLPSMRPIGRIEGFASSA